jgi:hypothetical protein
MQSNESYVIVESLGQRRLPQMHGHGQSPDTKGNVDMAQYASMMATCTTTKNTYPEKSTARAGELTP